VLSEYNRSTVAVVQYPCDWELQRVGTVGIAMDSESKLGQKHNGGALVRNHEGCQRMLIQLLSIGHLDLKGGGFVISPGYIWKPTSQAVDDVRQLIRSPSISSKIPVAALVSSAWTITLRDTAERDYSGFGSHLQRNPGTQYRHLMPLKSRSSDYPRWPGRAWARNGVGKARGSNS